MRSRCGTSLVSLIFIRTHTHLFSLFCAVILPAIRTILLFFLLVELTGCRNARRGSSPVAAFVPTAPEKSHNMPVDSSDTVYMNLHKALAVRAFYAHRSYKPVWINESGLTAQADSLIAMITDIRYYGFRRSNYHYAEILTNAEDPLKYFARTDALLTDAFFELANDLQHSRSSSKDYPIYESSWVSLLDMALASDLRKALESKEPKIKGYIALKMALKNILDTTLVREELIAGGQRMDHKVANMVELIEVNLHRWRKESQTVEGEFLYINIPSFRLDLLKGDSVLMSSKIIVGKPTTPTPELSSNVDCFIIFPYWYVPRKISVDEYLPEIKKNLSFLERNRFDVLNRKGKIVNPDSINWRSFNKYKFPVILRQREGTDNSLGIIKFTFDNPFGVYLHDTNAKRLFNSTVRAFSHGCIRMERANDLAHYLLTRDIRTKSRSLSNFLKQGKRRSFNVHPIPLYVRYFTCEVQDGVFLFYRDLYHLDKDISNLLYPSYTTSNL